MVDSIGKNGLGAVQQQRLSGELQEPAQFGERIVQSGKPKGSVAVALSTGWLSIKHFVKSLFGMRVSVDKPPRGDTAQHASKAVIHNLTRSNVDLLSVFGNLHQVLKRGQFADDPNDLERKGIEKGARDLLRKDLSGLNDLQLWRLYQNIKTNPEMLALTQIGPAAARRVRGPDEQAVSLQTARTNWHGLLSHQAKDDEAAGLRIASIGERLSDCGHVLAGLQAAVCAELEGRGFSAPAADRKAPRDDHVLNSVIDRVFKLDGDVDLAVKQMKAERRQRTIDFAMSTMPGLLKVKVQTVRVAEKPEVLKDQAQVGQRPKKVDPKLQADRLALEREEARNKLMEQTAIQDYTTAGGTVCFREINGWLRNPKGKLLHADVVKRKVALIKSGLAKLPDHQGEVYRGTHLTKEQLEAYSVGKRLVEAAFTSTSRSIIMGQSYADPAENGDRVPVLFVIDSKHGKSIEDYSAFRHEKEVLFTAGTAFEVTGRSVDAKGRHVVHMRDVDEQQNA
jgi:hypothetical protein